MQQFRLFDLFEAAFSKINAQMEDSSPVGVMTGFHDLDKSISSVGNGELVVVSSRPAFGKTSFLISIARQVSKETDVHFISLQHGPQAFAYRWLCQSAQVDSSVVRRGELSDDEAHRLMQAASSEQESKIEVTFPKSVTVEGIEDIVRRATASLIIIDGLEMIEATYDQSPRFEQLERVVRHIKALALDTDLPVILSCQTSSSVERREDHRPRLYDMRGTSALEEIGDIVLFIYQPALYDTDDLPGLAEIIVAKNRMARWAIVRLTHRPEFGRFDDYEHIEPPDGGYTFASDF